jgi:hypothetical protein
MRKDGTRNLSAWCKTCTKEESSRYQKENPLKVRQWGWRKHVKKKYNMTQDDYDQMFLNQNGVCAICGKEETHRNRSGEVGNLAVDHDHKSGKIRGLLCFSCNTGIGKFGDDPDRLQNAAKYLISYSDNVSAT